jgi:hypothetical protein
MPAAPCCPARTTRGLGRFGADDLGIREFSVRHAASREASLKTAATTLDRHADGFDPRPDASD